MRWRGLRGCSRQMVAAGAAAELEAGGEPPGRARRPGGGRKKLTVTDPGLKAALLGLVDPGSRGDPESPLRWTTKSTRNLAGELTRQGHLVRPGHGGQAAEAGALLVAGQRQDRRGRQATLTGTPSSGTSMRRPGSTWTPASR